MAFDPSTARPVFDPSTARPVEEDAPQPTGGTPTGVAEAAGTMLSGALAEPVAGIAGIASIPFKGSEAGDIVRRVREFLTYQPKTEEGRAALSSVAQALEPLTSAIEKAETAGGEAGFEMAGPIGGAIGETLPTLAGELVGAAGIQKSVQAAKRGKQAISGDIPGAQAELIQQAGESGIPVMTSDVMPPETFVGKSLQQTAEKIPLAGTGPVREGQQAMRQRAVEQVADKYGEYSYDAIIQSLKTKKDRVKSAAGSVLEGVGTQLDEIGEVDATATRSAIAEVIDELGKPNVIKSSSAAEDLSRLIEALDQPQTFTSLKENRTAFRDIVESTDKADRSQLTSRAKALLSKVQSALGADMDRLAKDNLSPQEYARWKRANAVYAEEAQSLKKTKLKNILDKGDVTPESVKTMLFSQNPSDLNRLYGSLTTDGRENARAAIISKVVDDISKRRAGMTPNAFATEMRKYKPHVETFFKGAEKRQLQGLQRVLEATYRAQEAGVTTPTGQALIPLLTGASIVTDPVATVAAGGTVGALARLYESAPVRNALLKLGSAKPNSQTFAQALLEAQMALTAAAQPERSGEPEQ